MATYQEHWRFVCLACSVPQSSHLSAFNLIEHNVDVDGRCETKEGTLQSMSGKIRLLASLMRTMILLIN